MTAAAHGAAVTALDWAEDAVELLVENASRNALEIECVLGDWRAFSGAFELVLGADLLYEERNADALAELLPSLAPEVLLAEPGRPHAVGFFRRAAGRWRVEELGETVYRLRRRT